MGIVNYLQRHLKALTRVLVESSLDIKEIGSVEDAEQPELIYKKSDSSGYLHIPTQEWLASQTANKGGARLIGVEGNAHTVLTNGADLQNTIKQIDNNLGALGTSITDLENASPFTTADFTFTTSDLVDFTPGVVRCFKNGNLVYISFDQGQYDFELLNENQITLTAPVGWAAAYGPFGSGYQFYANLYDINNTVYYFCKVIITSSFIRFKPADESDFLPGAGIVFEKASCFIYPKEG